jgi:RNA polymerase sigma-70 factor, ECF subfamily
MTFDEAVNIAFDAGRRAWPRIALDAAAFAVWAREAAVEHESLATRGEDLYLVAGCIAQDPQAILAFEKSFLAVITRRAGRVPLTPDQADELRQQLRVTLLLGPGAKVKTFKGQGPLRAWVQVCAVRLALTMVSNGGSAGSGGGAAAGGATPADAALIDELVSRDASQELLSMKARYRDAFQGALENCFSTLPPRQKTLLRMHFLEGMSIDEMGQVFGVHRATAARWLVAIRKQVLEELSRQVQFDLRTSSSEFASLFRLVRSDVRLSLHRILDLPDGRARGPVAEGSGGGATEAELDDSMSGAESDAEMDALDDEDRMPGGGRGFLQ